MVYRGAEAESASSTGRRSNNTSFEAEMASRSVSELDNATDAIVGRLSDPERVEAFQTKGLVVGYVQSRARQRTSPV